MPLIGQLALALALLLAFYSIVANVIGARRAIAPLIVSARHALWAMCAMITVAIAVLWMSLLQSDFTLDYVASYSSLALPTVYKFTSLWGGQQGSLLLWTWLLSVFTAIVAFQNRSRNRLTAPYALAVLALLAMFFLGMLNFVTRPFDLVKAIPNDGQDLNPLLQNYWMAIHPPSLYTGYVSASVPFAFGAAALSDFFVVLPHARESVRRALGLRSPRLGRLLGVGSRRERCVHAVAGDDRVSAFGDDPGAQGHAQSVEPRADRTRLRADALRHFFDAQRRDLVGPFIHAIGTGALLSDFPDRGGCALHGAVALPR